MTKTFCNRCGVEIDTAAPMNQFTMMNADGDMRVFHYCYDCYPRVLAELIPVLGERNNTGVVNYGIPDNTHVVAGGKDGKD